MISQQFQLGPFGFSAYTNGLYSGIVLSLTLGKVILSLRLGIGFPKQFAVYDLSVRLGAFGRGFLHVGPMLDLFIFRFVLQGSVVINRDPVVDEKR